MEQEIDLNSMKYEICRFIFLSIIALTPIVAFVVYAWTLVKVQDIYFTSPFLIMVIGEIVGLGLLIALLIRRVDILKKKNENQLQERRLYVLFYPQGKPVEQEIDLNSMKYEICRFIFLSIIALTPIVAFVFSNVEIAPNSPIGFVIKHGSNGLIGPNNITQQGGQWNLNIGGAWIDNYQSGIQIPINVVIFGIAGGYLRLLYTTSQKIKGGSQSDNKDTFFYQTLSDLSLIFLSPLLAIAVYLVFFQGGTVSIYTLAAISISIGLVTKEAIGMLTNFVSSRTDGKHAIPQTNKNPP